MNRTIEGNDDTLPITPVPDKKEILNFFTLLKIKKGEEVDVRYINRIAKTAKKSRGLIKSLVSEIVLYNQNKLEVSALINVSNGTGAKEKDIVGIRAFFIDVDGAELPTFLLDPTVIYRRDSTHWHAYWIIDP